MSAVDKLDPIRQILDGMEKLGVPVDFAEKTIDLKNPVEIPRSAVLQNRNRSSRASVLQMQGIAKNPDFDRLGVTKEFGMGSPIVAYGKIPENQLGKVDEAIMPDGQRYTVQYAVVEARKVLTSNSIIGTTNEEYFSTDSSKIRAIAGNGRVTGLQEAYKQNSAEEYREKMTAACASFRIPKAVIEKMKEPILVRVMQPKDVTSDIGDRSNRITGLSMDAVEIANNDANRVDLRYVEAHEDGSLAVSAVADFVKSMPLEEQANLVDKEGDPTRQAEERLSNAVFAKAYKSDELTRLKAKALNPEAKNIINGMTMAAPAMAALSDLGFGYDIRSIVASAAADAIQAVRKGIPLDQAVAQEEFFGDPEDNKAKKQILSIFAKNRRSGRAIGQTLIDLAKAIEQDYDRINPDTPDVFGGMDEQNNFTRADVIFRAINKVQPGEQAGLFDSVSLACAVDDLWNCDEGAAALHFFITGEGERPAAFLDSVRRFSDLIKSAN